MVERADSDGDGLVTLEDFYNIMTKKTFAWNYLHKIKFIYILITFLVNINLILELLIILYYYFYVYLILTTYSKIINFRIDIFI